MKEQTKNLHEALEKAEPKPPIVHELGGDFYYKCYWASCDCDINKWFNYCPRCGQKIDWEGVE